MTKETKAMTSEAKSIAAELLATFETYKNTNDARLAELEQKGAADTLLDEKLARLDKRIDVLSLKAARPENAPVNEQHMEHQTAWSRYLRKGDESGFASLDTKALSTTTDEQGGHLAPPELDRLIESRLMQASPMRQIASVRQTSAGTYRKPVSLGVGAVWANERDTRFETVTNDLELLEFPAGEIYAMPAATQTLLDDAYADIDEWIADEVETAFSVQESAAFVMGDGVSKPRGLLNYTIVSDANHERGKIGALDGDFTQTDAGDQLIDLIYAPKSQFRTNGRFLMNRRTAAIVRKLKDGDGRYLWVPGTGGEASTVLGYPVTELEDMPDIANGAAAIAFGDFRRACLIVDRQGSRVLRDPYMSKPYVL
ncbi:MAG: phage major capsid protein, partial [Hyphomonas sp.]|nr:phage major capsid protein [Hyphomonas sp.]